jgi:hypothetical protein
MPKPKVRNIAKVYHSTSLNTGNGGVLLSFHGSTPKKQITTINRQEIDWNLMPYILRDLRAAWLKERTNRLREIAAMDETNFNPIQPPTF